VSCVEHRVGKTDKGSYDYHEAQVIYESESGKATILRLVGSSNVAQLRRGDIIDAVVDLKAGPGRFFVNLVSAVMSEPEKAKGVK